MGAGALRIGIEQIHKPAGGLGGAVGGLFNNLQKEIDPSLPVTPRANAIKLLGTACAVLFEIQAEMKQRLRKQSAVVQQQGDQQAPQASVAVEKRMNGFELDVNQRCFDQKTGEALDIGYAWFRLYPTAKK